MRALPEPDTGASITIAGPGRFSGTIRRQQDATLALAEGGTVTLTAHENAWWPTAGYRPDPATYLRTTTT